MNATYVFLEKNGGVTTSAISCKTEDEMHDRFADAFLERGLEPCDVQFDEGHFEFEDDTSIEMVTAYQSDNKPSGKRNL